MRERIVVRGIVIREVQYGESDKILNILTREYGLITVSAKRSRNPKNNMLLASSALTYGEYELSGSESTRFYLNSATVTEPFMRIRNDVVLLTYCAHLFDLVLDSMRDVSSADEIYRLVLHAIERLSREGSDPDKIIHTFELKLLFILGFTPIIEECCVCGNHCSSLKEENVFFSFSSCGIVCSSLKCNGKTGDNMKITRATLECLRYISASPIEKVFSYNIEPSSALQLYDLASKYICERLERCYTKLKMLEQL